jgi:hypothetical protein
MRVITPPTLHPPGVSTTLTIPAVNYTRRFAADQLTSSGGASASSGLGPVPSPLLLSLCSTLVNLTRVLLLVVLPPVLPGLFGMAVYCWPAVLLTTEPSSDLGLWGGGAAVLPAAGTAAESAVGCSWVPEGSVMWSEAGRGALRLSSLLKPETPIWVLPEPLPNLSLLLLLLITS